MADFRFEQLEIWKSAIELGNALFDIAQIAEGQKKYRFSEQLNGAALSISNNIAEGSGASSNKEFARFLSIARKSLFECVNILHVFELRGIISSETRLSLYPELVGLSKQIYFSDKSFYKNNLPGS